jgi:hypothetical protein
MLRSQLGNLGNLAVTIAFIAALLSMIFYFFAAKENRKNGLEMPFIYIQLPFFRWF